MSAHNISRREFIKKGTIGTLGAALTAYTINDFYLQGNPNEFSRCFRGEAPDEIWTWSKKAMYYDTISDGSIACKLCPHECRIGLNDRGFCKTRVNKNNKLHTLAYGNPCAVHIDPIEKKPLYHFLPGSPVFSIATAGCNLRCLNCQNWSISQFKPEETKNYDLFPGKVVDFALNKGCASIAYTYSDPVIFYEYAVDTGKIAKERGIKNVWVSAGYINEKPLTEAAPFIDAANIDLKGYDDGFYKKICGARLAPVLKTLKTLRQEGVWVEITRLVVPALSDDIEDIRKMCLWIYENMGADCPVHFSRFHPAYKVKYLQATPVELLKACRSVAMDTGLRYVYVGNVPGYIEGQTTFCPKCKTPVIKRNGFIILEYNLQQNRCQVCNESIAGLWRI